MSKTRKYAKRRPCKICRRWFSRDARLGDRQETCSRPECQRERHRRNCKTWREKNTDCSKKAEGFRARLGQKEEESQSAKQEVIKVQPISINWSVVEFEIGLKEKILFEEICYQLINYLQDEMLKKVFKKQTFT